MAKKQHAGTLGAILVLLATAGLIVVVCVILLMMYKQPGIQHRPRASVAHAARALGSVL